MKVSVVKSRCGQIVSGLALLFAVGAGANALAGDTKGGQMAVPSTPNDFFQPGTQENMAPFDPLIGAASCAGCHSFQNDGVPDEELAPFNTWVASMMGQAARDPVFHVATAISENDAPGSSETCMRCHAPTAWLNGRSNVIDPYQLTAEELEGISCNFCHRNVDPTVQDGNPLDDDAILADLNILGWLPEQPANARYVVDPFDVRRGPLDDVPINFHGVPIIVSPFHQRSEFCGTCHDVTNAMYHLQKDGTYALVADDMPHPTQDINEMMPEQRTYSEWLHSDFANGGVTFPDGRFGGDHPTGVMSSCQDCHMPTQTGGVCVFWDQPPFFPRNDLNQHVFIGANTWVLDAIRTIDADGMPGPDFEDISTGLNDENVAMQMMRTTDLLQAASDMEVIQVGSTLKARVINMSGHKLPTGYPEGRRLWLNVKFFDETKALIDERGTYDFVTAELETGDTKVYEAKLGIDEAVAAVTNLPAGESFHLTLNNVVLSDNRIPPMGFTNAAFESIRSQPVNYAYADGQYWDDTEFVIPAGAIQAIVTLYYQTSSKEYMDFLNEASGGSEVSPIPLYQEWINHGKSAPVVMDMTSVPIVPSILGDLDGDGFVAVQDLLELLTQWGLCQPNLCSADLDCNGSVDIADLLLLLSNWG